MGKTHTTVTGAESGRRARKANEDINVSRSMHGTCQPTLIVEFARMTQRQDQAIPVTTSGSDP